MFLFLFLLDYARINHPFAPENMDLRGHIGNVFASDRQRLGGRSENGQCSVPEENNGSNDELNESAQEDDE